MKVSVSKWKNQTIYYLSKSVWVDGKSTTKTIEKIGSEDKLHNTFSFRTDYEIVSQREIKKILTETRK